MSFKGWVFGIWSFLYRSVYVVWWIFGIWYSVFLCVIFEMLDNNIISIRNEIRYWEYILSGISGMYVL